MKTTFILIALYLVFNSVAAEARGHKFSSNFSGFTRIYSCPGCNSNDHYVSPTIRSNGQFVNGHMKSNSNGKTTDNFTYRGNLNPYTGVYGTRN